MTRTPANFNCITIVTTLRVAHIWVDGYERRALSAYQLSPGERIVAVSREKWWA